MNRENRILITASFVILLLIITSLNFEGDITGNIGLDKSKTYIETNPDVTNPGGLISIFISPGPEGINEMVSFYRAEDGLRKISVGGVCGEYKCFNDASISFVIPSNWEYGIYYVQVYDYGIKDFVKTEFTLADN